MIVRYRKKFSDTMPKPCVNHRSAFSLEYETLELVGYNEKMQSAISQEITYMMKSICFIAGMLQT
jgi:hypothetical protein